MLGTFPKVLFPKRLLFPNVQFPKQQLPKFVLAAALGPFAACRVSEGLWEVNAGAIVHLGSSNLGNGHLGNHPWENAFWEST